MYGTQDEAIFEVDDDNDILDNNNTYSDVLKREDSFKELLGNSGNDLDNER